MIRIINNIISEEISQKILEIGSIIASTWGGFCISYEIDYEKQEIFFTCYEHGEEFYTSISFEDLKKEYDIEFVKSSTNRCKKCGECKYYGGDVNQGDYSVGVCTLIEKGKLNAEFKEYAYHHSSRKCDVKAEDEPIFKKRYLETIIKEKQKLIKQIKMEINEHEKELLTF